MGLKRRVRRVLAYDLTMRRLFLCFLLCLMPLRLWAGVWMPMAASFAHHTEAAVSANQAPHADAAHDCHDTLALAGSAHEAHGTHDAVADAALQKADCHDGTCQLCGVCHQSVSLTAWPQLVPVFQAHPQPGTESQPHAAMASSPLIKPPIS